MKPSCQNDGIDNCAPNRLPQGGVSPWGVMCFPARQRAGTHNKPPDFFGMAARPVVREGHEKERDCGICHNPLYPQGRKTSPCAIALCMSRNFLVSSHRQILLRRQAPTHFWSSFLPAIPSSCHRAFWISPHKLPGDLPSALSHPKGYPVLAGNRSVSP